MKKLLSFKTMITLMLFVVFIVFTVCINSIDVQAEGPRESLIGLAHINKAFHNFIGVNMFLYELTDWLGLVPILFAIVYALIGLAQWIKGRSIKKVDPKIIMLGCFYLLVIGTYILFESMVINYRPILIDGFLEPSYPSTHIFVSICIMGTSLWMIQSVIKNHNIKFIINTISVMILAVIVVGRIFSGVHWLTDILGGLLLSGAFLSLFLQLIKITPYRNKAYNSSNIDKY